MTQYMMTYLGGDQPSSQEEGQKHFAKYREWLNSLGDAAISPANPLKNVTTIMSYGSVMEGGASTMSGFTILEAESMLEAIEMAKQCPFLELGGSLEVSELMKMTYL